MPKIQAKAGQSLGDQYDVVGSAVALEQLVTNDVPLVHEMGGVLLSERMEIQNRQISAEAVLQGVNFDEGFDGQQLAPSRLMAVAMIATVTARILRAALMYQDPATGREFPLVAWDSTLDVETPILWSDNGAARALAFWLTPTLHSFDPILMTKIGVLHTMPDLKLVGRTEAFGAGTVTIRCIMGIAAPFGGPQGATVGLPIPSW